MNFAKQIKKIIKSLEFDSKDIVYLSENVSYEVNNQEIIKLILEKEINKIQGIVWQISSESINTNGEYIDVVGRYIHNEMLENKELTNELYNKYLKENNIPVFHENVDVTFMISEMTEIIAKKLVEKNDNYLMPLSVFHSSTLLRNYQQFFIKKKLWRFENVSTRKETALKVLRFFLEVQNKYLKNKDDLFIDTHYQIESETRYSESSPLDSFEYNNDLSLKENILRFFNESNYERFLNSNHILYSNKKEHSLKIDSHFFEKLFFYDLDLENKGFFDYECDINEYKVNALEDPSAFFARISYNIIMDDIKIPYYRLEK
tara:strand:+ start:15970 stop:16923 length:954 start_codon:yes stop_codon:yes gene_type:complete